MQLPRALAWQFIKSAAQSDHLIDLALQSGSLVSNRLKTDLPAWPSELQ